MSFRRGRNCLGRLSLASAWRIKSRYETVDDRLLIFIDIANRAVVGRAGEMSPKGAQVNRERFAAFLAELR